MITYSKLIENAKKKIDLNCLEHRAIYLFLQDILNVDKAKILMMKDDMVDDSVLEKSTSGGFFSFLCYYVLLRQGVVFGAAWTEDLNVKHIMINNL